MSGSGKSKAARKESVTKSAPAAVVLKLRLFVGGLGPTVGASDLLQRFAPLGTVHRIDLVKGKKGWDAEEALQRGFAYVDFEASSEASLHKLFSAYNGCKWKGGVLRVEKAKEQYMDRLRREWAEAEAEAAVKARIAEEAATASAISQPRHMYSSNCEDVSGSPESNRVDLEEIIGEEGDGIAVDADEIAAQIEEERKKQLDLFSKLFPEDKGAGDEEEKVIEIAKLRAFPMPTDVNAKKRKHVLENPSVPVASSSVQPIEGDASVLKSSMHESGALDVKDKQKSKNRRVKFSEETDTCPDKSLNNENVTMKNQHKGSSDAAKGVRPILKKTQEDSKKMDVDRDGDGSEEEEDNEEEEEEYYPSSRSPSPEGGFSDESKWTRLFKYAGLKKGPELTKPRDSVPTVWTGISLDDDDEEPAVAEVETLHRDAVGNDGMFSGVLSEHEDEESDPPQQSTLGVNATASVVSKKKKIPVEKTQRDGVGSDGIFSGVLSDPEEDTDSPQPTIFGSKVHDSVVLKKSKTLINDPETISETLPDQGDESSDFEDANEDLQDTESDASGDSETDEEEDADEEEDEEEDEDDDMEDFIDAAPSLKSLTPTPLNEAAKASKWAKMFKSATSVAEPVEGVFSGSLEEADVPVRPRPAEKVQKMFEPAVANHAGSVSEAPKVSDKIVASEMTEDTSRHRLGEENASTSSEDIPNEDVAKPEKNEEEDEGAGDRETGVMRGNLLAQFNMEQDKPHASSSEKTMGAQSSRDVQQEGLDLGKEEGTDRLGVSSSTPLPEGQTAVDENTKWVQRATWKSLMGADGRASFSLKQLTGEPETTKATTDVKKTEQSLNAFSFNFARNPPEPSEAKPKPINVERAVKMPQSGSALEKEKKIAKVPEDEAGCSFMKSADAEKEWRASRSELRMDSRAKHKAAVKKMKKMKGSGGAR